MSVFEAGVDEGAMVENDRRSLERLKQLQVKEIEIVKWPDQSDKNHKFFIPRKVSRPSFRGGFWILRIQGPPVDEATWGDTKREDIVAPNHSFQNVDIFEDIRLLQCRSDEAYSQEERSLVQ